MTYLFLCLLLDNYREKGHKWKPFYFWVNNKEK